MLTSKRTKVFTLIALYTGMLGMLLNAGSTSTMLPAAALDIGGQDIYSLVNTLGGVIGAVAMPLYGFFSAKYPRSKPILFGVSLVVSALVILSKSVKLRTVHIVLRVERILRDSTLLRSLPQFIKFDHRFSPRFNLFFFYYYRKIKRGIVFV